MEIVRKPSKHMSYSRRISLVALLALVVTVVLIGFGRMPQEPPVSVLYLGYGDYYGGPFGPRQVEFQVVSQRRSPNKVLGPSRVEFRAGVARPNQGRAVELLFHG